MNIPSRVNPFGYDNSLPPGYFRVEFLESTGTQWITSPTPGSNERGARAIYSHSSSQSWHIGWAFCAFAGDSYISEIFGALRVNIGSASPLLYGWKGLARLDVGDEVITANTIYEVSLNFKNDMKIKLQTPTAVYEDNLASPANQTAEPVHVAGIANVPQKLIGHIYLYEETRGSEIVHSMSPAINPAGIPCVYDSVTGNSYINSGSGKFIAGCTMDQAESLGSAIPSNTSITVSFPWEAKLVQHNSRVEYSLEQARNKGCTISVQYREPKQDSVIYNKYVDCVNAEDMTAANPEYKTDLTIEGAWEYSIPRMVNALDLFADSPMKKFSVTLPETVSNHENLFLNSGLEGAVELDVYAGYGSLRTYANRTNGATKRQITSAKINFYGGKCYCHSCFHTGWGSAYDTNLESVEILTHFEAPSNMNWDGICDNCRGLKQFSTNIEGKVRYLGNGFNGCQLDKDSVLCVEKMLMTTVTSHQTVLGIHVDWKNDPEVLEAIDKIKTRVTNVYVQWNGTPTVSTFSLRQPPVYAKMDTIEDEDGIPRDRLLWGHYVSDWEAAGCQEFTSLEEAYEHFNLEPDIEE